MKDRDNEDAAAEERASEAADGSTAAIPEESPAAAEGAGGTEWGDAVTAGEPEVPESKDPFAWSEHDSPADEQLSWPDEHGAPAGEHELQSEPEEYEEYEERPDQEHQEHQEKPGVNHEPADKPADEPTATAASAPVSSAPAAVAAAPAEAPAGGEAGPRSPGSGQGPHAAVAWLALLLVLLLAAGGFLLLLQSQQRESDVLQRLQGLEALSGRDDSTLVQLGETLKRQIELEVGAAQTALRGELQEQLQRVREQNAANADAARDSNAQVAATVSKVERTQAEVSQSLQALRSQLDERLAQLDSQLARQRAQLEQVSAEDEAVWMLAEAQYLLRLANQRLIMTGDVASALALLDSADTVLREFDVDGALHEVRSVLASDMAALRAVPKVDTQGIYVRLSALMERAAALVAIEPPALQLGGDAAEGEDWQSRLRRGYQAAIDQLSRYIVVRRREAPIESLIDPQWEQLLQQNVRMLLQQAQIALLAGNQPLYVESLERASGWLREFFADDTDAGAVASALDELRAARISAQVPDVARSVRALQEALRRREENSAEASAS